MKSFHFLFILCTLFILSDCKKDAGITVPAELQDFSGLYSLEGDIEIQSSPVEKIPFQWVVSDANSGNGYQVATGKGHDSDYRWTIGEIYNGVPGYGQFELIVHGGWLQGTGPSDSHWAITELDSIFQRGKQLSFGTNFGQVEIIFDANGYPFGEYWTLWADNSNNKITIEEINDLKIYLPEYKWAKQVVVNFNANLDHYPFNGSTSIILKNCRASVFFAPGIQ